MARLNKHNSKKTERKVQEILRKNRIKHRTKVKILTYTVDFLIGRVILEIDGRVHGKYQSPKRNEDLFRVGYVPIHLSSEEIYSNPDIERKILHLIHQN